MTRAHRRQTKRLRARLRARLGHRVDVRCVSCRTPGLYCVPPRWRVYLVQTAFDRRVIGEGQSRREALRDAARGRS